MKVLWIRHFMVTPLMYCNQLQLSTSKEHPFPPWHTPFCQRYYHFHHFTQSQNLRVISDSSFLFSYLFSQSTFLLALSSKGYSRPFHSIATSNSGATAYYAQIISMLSLVIPLPSLQSFLNSPENQYPACSACHAR